MKDMPRKCLYCGEETKNLKFCNHSCSAIYNNKRRIISTEHKSKTSQTVKLGWLMETPKRRKERLKKNREVWANPEQRKNHSKIQKESHKRRREELIKTIPFKQLPRAIQRRILFEENGNICSKCKFEYTDPITKMGPFEIHHRDGDNSNWERLNLEILCLICHWKTANWRFRGRKHTDKSRLKIKINRWKEKQCQKEPES